METPDPNTLLTVTRPGIEEEIERPLPLPPSDIPALDERPLPPFPADTSAEEIYERWATHGSTIDVSRQYERWRGSGFRGTPSDYADDEPDGNELTATIEEAHTPANNSTSQEQSSYGQDQDREQALLSISRANNPRDSKSLRHDRPSSSTNPSTLLQPPTYPLPPKHSAPSTHSNSFSSSGNVPLMNHPSSRRRHQRRAQELEQTETVVPRWQPDAEVTICPICRTQFSFFVRKHHCRKCGRVVCNSCSPHRITIPYQYIVQPPTEESPSSPTGSNMRPIIDPARAGSSVAVNGLGGGERVRLCNPCVPDPNVAPPQTRIDSNTPRFYPPQDRPSPHSRSVSTASTPYVHSPYSQYHEQPPLPPLPPYNQQRPLVQSGHPQQYPTFVPERRGQSYSSRDQQIGIEALERRARGITISGGPSSHFPLGQTSTTPHPFPPQYGSISSSSLQHGSHVPTQRPAGAPRQTRQPRREIPEEDECWVCHIELPSRTLPNYQALRDQHVQDCIISHTQGNSSSPPPAITSTPTMNTPARTSTPSTSTVSASTSTSTPTPTIPSHSSSSKPSASTRPTGMFPYLATEKDCVDDAECTICMEEYVVGVEMTRLECFCRFHRRCILEWFEKKDRQCPVHQHQYGY